MSEPLKSPVAIDTPPPEKFSSGRWFLLWGAVSFAVPILLLRFPIFLFPLFYFHFISPVHVFYILSLGASLALWYGLRLGRRTTWGLSLVMALSGSFVLIFIASLIINGFAGMAASGPD